jgi:hypothetical protein
MWLSWHRHSRQPILQHHAEFIFGSDLLGERFATSASTAVAFTVAASMENDSTAAAFNSSSFQRHPP